MSRFSVAACVLLAWSGCSIFVSSSPGLTMAGQRNCGAQTAALVADSVVFALGTLQLVLFLSATNDTGSPEASGRYGLAAATLPSGIAIPWGVAKTRRCKRVL